MEKNNPPPYSAHNPGMYPPGPPPPGSNVYPPLPPEMHQQPQPQVVVHTSIGFGPQPSHMRCPSCHADVTTTVKTEANTKTHLFALLLCLFGCCLCSCIPYCVESCQSQMHYCPNCKAYLGKHDN